MVFSQTNDYRVTIPFIEQLTNTYLAQTASHRLACLGE
jgi:hypothetical protein